MARGLVGAVAAVGPDGSVLSVAGATGVLYRTRLGATSITDVLDEAGAVIAGGLITATADGLCPLVQPELGTASGCFVSFNGGPRQWLSAHAPNADAVGAVVAAQIATRVVKGAIVLSITDYDGATPSAIAGVLDNALADGAATKRVVALGPGAWVTAKAGRHQIKSYSGLTGDRSGGTILRFTDPAGGIQVQDTAGTLGTYVYETKIDDIALDGMGVVPTPLKAIRCEEMDLTRVRIQGFTDAAMELTDTSLFTSRRLEIAGSTANPDRVGIRFLGGTGSIGIDSPNFFACTPISIGGASLTDLRIFGSPWVEGCPTVILIDSQAAALSVGQVHVTGRVISILTGLRLLRAAATHTAGTNITRARFHDLNVTANASTSPLIDLTAAALNAGNVAIEFTDSTLALAGGVASLVQAHPSQTWNYIHTRLQDLWSAAPNTPYNRAKWWGTVYAAGGVWPKPIDIFGWGTPEGQSWGYAPVGSICRDGQTGAVYRKAGSLGTAINNTNWVAM